MTARLGNALYWAFSGLAGILVLLVLLVATAGISGWDTDPLAAVLFGVPFFIAALLLWLIGRTCHYVLGGDASALWERALLARARRSAEFRNSLAVIALIGIGALGYGVWAEQTRNRISPIQGTTTAAATVDGPAISAADLSLSDVTLGYYNGIYGLHGTITNKFKSPLATVTFEVTMQDCPPTDYSKLTTGWGPRIQCRIVGQEQTTTGADIPAGQTRTFDAGLTFANMPPEDPKRQREWSWRIVSIKKGFDPSAVPAEGD